LAVTSIDEALGAAADMDGSVVGAMVSPLVAVPLPELQALSAKAAAKARTAPAEMRVVRDMTFLL
jgi:hypothetical protein